MQDLENLKVYEKHVADLEYIVNLLNWELRVNIPEDAKEKTIERITKLELEIHNLKIDKEYEKLLNKVISSDYFNTLEDAEQRYIKRMQKLLLEEKRIPEEFLEKYSREINISNQLWEKAKNNNDYNLFKPSLKKMIELTKELYSYKNPDMDLYDAMLDTYEEGLNSKEIDKLFKELKEGLIPIIKKVSVKNPKRYTKKYSDTELINVAKYVLNYIGFDMKKGALGIYPHGFTEKITNDDVRIAFKNSCYPLDFLSTIIHEGGHGIFEQNSKDNLKDYETVHIDFYGLHESQSRFFENILGRNKNFWIPIYDDIKEMLHLDLTLDEFVDELNQVECSLIRTEADELTYCLHIIIRYEIERDLFSGKITVDELPKIWNEKMEEYLGLTPVNDSDGLMQDVHWSEGSFGYFPSYLLGTIFDGMFKEVIEEKLGSIDKLLAAGKIKEITNFLIKNIYSYGAAYTGKEVIERVCNKKLSVKPIIRYFEDKYLK